MFEIIFNRLSTHAQFSILLGTMFGTVAIIVALVMGFSIPKTILATIALSAITYLVIDFYEHFGDAS